MRAVRIIQHQENETDCMQSKPTTDSFRRVPSSGAQSKILQSIGTVIVYRGK